MGGLVEDIWDGIVSIGDAIWDGVTGIAGELWGAIWDGILNPILEPIVGLFGFEDETIIQVQVITQRYFPDEPKFVPTLIRNIITSVTESTDLMDEVRIGLINNGITSGRKFYNYGKLGESRTPTSTVSDGYVFGTPTISKTYGDLSVDELSTVLLTFHSGATSLTYNLYSFGKIEIVSDDPWKYWGYFQLYENYPDWDQATKTYWDGTEDLTYIKTQYNAELDYWEVLLHNELSEPTLLPIATPSDPAKLNMIVEYEVVDGIDDGLTAFWIYDTTSGDYPQLEQDPASIAPPSDFKFMPVVPLKADSQYLDADKNSQEYLTTKTMLNYIGIETDSLISAVKENPDADLVVDAFVSFGANLYDDDQSINKYLFAFFTSVASDVAVSKSKYEEDIANPSVQYPAYNAIAIKEQNFNLAYQFNYIHIEELTGSVGSINWVNKTINYSGTRVKENPTSTVVFTVQTGVNTYTKVTVFGLSIIHLVTSTTGAIRTKAFGIVSPTSTTDEDVRAQKNFIIPISLEILNSYGSVSDKEKVLYRSICFRIYAELITELAWYETESFLTFLNIIITIAAFVFFGPEGGYTVSEVVKQVLIQIALQYALELVLKSTDNEFIKALAYLAYLYGSAKNWGQDMFALTDPAVALRTVQAAGDFYLNIESTDLLAELEDFQQMKDEMQSEIDRVSELIEMPEGIGNVLAWIKTDKILHYEPPSNFFARTLETNPGAKTLNVITTFYDRMLQLPELDPRLDGTSIIFTGEQETVAS